MSVINIKKEHLQQNGYKDFQDWAKNPNHIYRMHWVIIPVQWHWRSIEFTPTRGGLIIQCERYIGRDMSFYIAGTTASKWHNPFHIKKYGLNTCLEMYENIFVIRYCMTSLMNYVVSNLAVGVTRKNVMAMY